MRNKRANQRQRRKAALVVHHIPFGQEPDLLEFAEFLYPKSKPIQWLKTAADAIVKLEAATLKGDQHAGACLVAHMQRAVRLLEKLYQRDDMLPMFRAILSDTPLVPVAANSDRRCWKQIKELCDRLGVGTNTPGIRRNPKGRAKHGVATGYALGIYRALKWNRERLATLVKIKRMSPRMYVDRARWPAWALTCATLPPFSADSAPQWWKVGLECFKETIPHPREVERLRRLVISKKREEAGKFSWYPSDFDSKIFDKIRKAFYTLAHQVTAT